MSWLTIWCSSALIRAAITSASTGTRRPPAQPRTGSGNWGAAVVVSGSYFGQDHAPLTPLRLSGRPAGPAAYQSTHGALVANGDQVDILDLRNRDVLQAIAEYPEAMVSYPLPIVLVAVPVSP